MLAEKDSLAFFFPYAVFFLKFYPILTTYSSNKHRRNTTSTLVLECRKRKHLYEILPPPIFFKVFNCDGIVAFHKLDIYLKLKICYQIQKLSLKCTAYCFLPLITGTSITISYDVK